MSNFPTLKTGAVLQYPAQKEVRYATDIVRFIDGTEQRFREYQTSLHRWMIRLELLDQGELQVLREFFRAQAGGAESFAFTDPWDGTAYANCTLEGGDMTLQLVDEMKGSTSLTIRENRG
jgi:phage-related protein